MLIKGDTESVILLLLSRIDMPLTLPTLVKLVYCVKREDFKDFDVCRRAVNKSLTGLRKKYLVEIVNPEKKRHRKYRITDLGRGSFICNKIEINLVHAAGFAEGTTTRISVEGNYPKLAKEGKLLHVV